MKKKKSHKKRSRDSEAEGSSSSSDGSSVSSSSSESSSPSEHSSSSHSRSKKREHHRKHKHSHNRKHSHKHKHSHKKSGSQEKKKSKKNKTHSEEGKDGANPLGYRHGVHGIIQDTDFYIKREEFQAWLLDYKKVNPEALSQSELKKLFATFAEDYNLGILPEEKYYNLLGWERKKAYEKEMKERKQALKPPKKSASLKETLKAWTEASKEEVTFLGNDEELRRIEQKRELEERKLRASMSEKEIARLESLAKESEAMMQSLLRADDKFVK
jgi:hypothetical protein